MVDVGSWLVLLYLLIGTWATSSSAAILNQVMEIKHDAKMSRTKNRPLVKGLIQQKDALLFGLFLGVFGLIFLFTFINSLTIGELISSPGS